MQLEQLRHRISITSNGRFHQRLFGILRHVTGSRVDGLCPMEEILSDFRSLRVSSQGLARFFKEESTPDFVTNGKQAL